MPSQMLVFHPLDCAELDHPEKVLETKHFCCEIPSRDLRNKIISFGECGGRYSGRNNMRQLLRHLVHLFLQSVYQELGIYMPK